MRILIVDDDLTGRRVLQALLAARATIDTAVTGHDAMRLFAASLQLGQPYDLVCLDSRLPDMDAPAALRAIRALERAGRVAGGDATKVLLTTGGTDAPELLQAFRGPGEGHVAKPVDRRHLEHALQEIGLGAGEPVPAR